MGKITVTNNNFVSKNMSIGIITYDFNHLKTEYLVNGLINKKGYKNIKLIALPFKSRKERHEIFSHRPSQFTSSTTRELASANNLDFISWNGKDQLNYCDLYLIGGAGILDENAIKNLRIINAHGGIIPAVRGLDSFKWAIYHQRQMGVSLHYIDEKVDVGELISIKQTKLLPEDSIKEFANRHYQLEIDMLVDFEYHINKPSLLKCKSFPPTMRMPNEKEKETLLQFKSYKKKFAIK